MARIEELCEQVVSFCPVYTDEGNCTEILLNDGCMQQQAVDILETLCYDKNQ